MLPFPLHLSVALPDWVSRAIDGTVGFPDDETRMRLAIRLARENVIRATGGPFGAAIFEAESGRLAGVGVNLVVPLHNSCLHAEMVAFMTAQAAAGTYSLAAAGLPAHELYTSCEPCAMCAATMLQAGIARVFYAGDTVDGSGLFERLGAHDAKWRRRISSAELREQVGLPTQQRRMPAERLMAAENLAIFEEFERRNT